MKRRSNFYSHLGTVCILMINCQNREALHLRGQAQNTNQQVIKTQTANETAAVTSNSGQTAKPLIGIAELFLDKPNFTVADVMDSTVVPCRESGLKGIVPWTSALKSHFVRGLQQFPLLEESLPHFSGYFLTTGLNSTTAGTTCHDQKQNKMIVMMNKDAFDDYYEDHKMELVIHDLLYNFVIEKQFDTGTHTLIHETAHVIEVVQNLIKKTPDFVSKMASFREMSWKSINESKFRTLDNTLLTANLDDPPFGCVKKTAPYGIPGFELQGSTPTRTAQYITDQYKYLEKETNFVSHYGATNAVEDFAESLAYYFILSRYHFSYTKSVYTKERFTEKEMTTLSPIYVLDLNAMAKIAKPQRDKLCFIAKEFFKEECKI